MSRRTLVFAAVWLSPAALLGMPPLLLADGTRGLWPPLVFAGGALVAVLLLADARSRGPGPSAGTLLDLARRRWPAAGEVLAPIALAEVGSALLFLWAQLAAGRELAQTLGWSPPAAVGLAASGLAVLAWRRAIGAPLALFGSGLALLGLALPLAVTQAATVPWWPRVWAEAASRSGMVFASGGIWTTEGRPVRGAASDSTLPFVDEQRVRLLGRGRVRILQWEGGESRHDVTGETELTLRPGDRLVLPEGFPLRFQPGRRIPGAPASGSEWVDPPGRRADWRVLVGMGVTLLFGGLGLAAVHAALPIDASPEGRRAAVSAAGLVVLGVTLAILWALYAVWLTPEIYVGGILGTEVYELPGSVAALGLWGRPLRLLALGGLAAGGVVAALAALGVVPGEVSARRDLPWLGTAGVVAVAGLLGIVTPARPWPLLLGAFGLAASAGAPAAVLIAWGERTTARGVAAGASLGLGVFGALSVVELAGRVGLGHAAGSVWLDWLLAWPALVALPANALTVWLLGSRRTATPGGPLPPGLAELHQ